MTAISASVRPREPRATIDCETRSEADLLDVGTWAYSRHPSTECLCLCYRLPYWEPGRVDDWWPAFPEHGVEAAPDPVELWQWIADGGAVEAHNAFFERSIWRNVLQRLHGWPAVPSRSWRCSAAKGAAHSMPRSLEALANALGVRQRKDVEGAKLMKAMSRPRKPLKADAMAWVEGRARGNDGLAESLRALGVGGQGRARYRLRVVPDDERPWRYRAELRRDSTELAVDLPVWWRFDPGEFAGGLVPYCRQDVLTEEACSEALPDLTPTESEVYLMDQDINERGVQLDMGAIDTALSLVGVAQRDLNAELLELTDGRVERATQRARLLAWLHEHGAELPNTQGPTVDEWLARPTVGPRARRGLELMRALGRSSTAKYLAFQAYADPADGRARGMLLYHGAGTGRWAGSGPQPHNFPRGAIKDMALVWRVLSTRDVELIELLYDDLMTTLSHALRGVIVASPGHRLVAADYAAIEARVIFWLAGEDTALEILRRGDCIYCDMASTIYNRTIVKGVDLDERQMGKQAILGLGFQMGWKKFVDTCAKYGIMIDPDFAQFVVNAYREKYHRVKRMWWDQEAAAVAAVRANGSRVVRCGRVSWAKVGRFLYCKLPSGRCLAYPDPAVTREPLPWDGTKTKEVLTFMGVDSYTKKWCRQRTYGGTLVENIVQATARDLMADAMLRCEASGVYRVVLSVHDELVTEVREGVGSVRDLERLMSRVPDWADGCPVVAEGWEGPRYRK